MAGKRDQRNACEPFGLFNYAKCFLDAACSLYKEIGSTNPTHTAPIYYLSSHSIELVVKAYLMAHGRDLNELKKKPYGHDLCRLYCEACNYGLPRQLRKTGSKPYMIAAIIELTNKYYHGKEFEYLFTGFKSLPKLDALIQCAKGLLTAVYPVCLSHMKSTKLSRDTYA
ncbi:MAG: hypothetical protein KQH53_11350 [Desulfarculaceae bacterium]|nr:hypothetical protein [Desulfarculaceae bacterium]